MVKIYPHILNLKYIFATLINIICREYNPYLFSNLVIFEYIIIKNSMKVVLLDSSKFELNSLLEVVPWSKVDFVITNDGAPADVIETIQKDTRVILA